MSLPGAPLPEAWASPCAPLLLLASPFSPPPPPDLTPSSWPPPSPSWSPPPPPRLPLPPPGLPPSPLLTSPLPLPPPRLPLLAPPPLLVSPSPPASPLPPLLASPSSWSPPPPGLPLPCTAPSCSEYCSGLCTACRLPALLVWCPGPLWPHTDPPGPPVPRWTSHPADCILPWLRPSISCSALSVQRNSCILPTLARIPLFL